MSTQAQPAPGPLAGAVMLHALIAFEETASAGSLGYDVLINSDEETGSLSSAALIAATAGVAA